MSKKPYTLNSRKKRFNAIEPYIWIAPSIILMSIFIIVPIFTVFRTAFNDVSRTGKLRGFNGFDNFRSVLSSTEFHIVLQNTIVWTIVVVVLSTILGFIPFMVGTGKEAFWFPLSAGTIGGLLMSILGIFIFLPVFTLKKK